MTTPPADPDPPAPDSAPGAAPGSGPADGRLRRPSRRAVLTGSLIGAIAVVAGAGDLVERDVLPGRVALARALGQAGQPGAVSRTITGPIQQGSFVSAARHGITTNWAIAYPPGVDPKRPQSPDGARLPVCVVLHGRGDSAQNMITLGYPGFLADAVRTGLTPFALASVDGAQAYWHARRSGDDPGTMVLTELLPRLAARGLAAGPQDRIAFLGWSMGGYGSLLLASQLGPGRVAAIAAESPALWLDPAGYAAGAFDSEADFRAHDVFGRRRLLSQIPIRIDCGLADPFHTAAKEFAAGLHPHPVTDLGAGDHSGGYWRAKAPAAIRFIGAHLGGQ